MTVEKLDSLEDRIQKPGYLLLLVVVLLFLIVGFVDLIDQVSRNPTIFGRYSPKYFAVIVAYSAMMLAWASLLRKPNDDRWLQKALDFIQKRPVIAVLLLLGIFLLFAAMWMPQSRVHQLLTEFPAMQATIMVIALLAGGLILFYQWGDESRPQRWRKIIVAILGLLVVTEVVIQLLAFFGLMPSLTTTRDAFAPYTRVYQSEEGLGNGVTNAYGRYTSEFQLLPDSYRIAVIGDTFVQGLQVGKEENMGVLLEQKLAAADKSDQEIKEVLTLGYPDYGPGMYLSNWMLNVNQRDFEPDEAIIVFDLGSDFQEVDGPGQGVPYFDYIGQGRAQLDLEYFFTDLHNPEHVVYFGHEGLQLVRTLRSHYLTPRYLVQLLSQPTAAAARADDSKANEDIDRPNGFVFNEATNDEALLIASAQINMANEQLRRGGIATNLVTIPAFTEAFYGQEQWNTTFGDSDLLLPEKELRETAATYGISFLGLGEYMASQGMTPAEVQTLYYQDGLGHFTPEGHALAAEAIYQCFYAQTLTSADGCDIQP